MSSNIIIIDDNQDDRDMIARQLRYSLTDVIINTYDSTKEVYGVIDDGNFDVAILDYKLIGMDGIELLKRIKTKYPNKPVIMVTGTGTEEVAVEGMKLGLDDYILKSSRQLHRVSTSVQSVLSRARQQKALQKVESILAAIISSSDDAIYSYTTDGIVLSWNHGAQKLYGYTDKEIIGKDIRTTIPEDKIIERENAIAVVLAGQSISRMETLRLDKERHVFDAAITISTIKDNDNNIIGISDIARDITAKKMTETALKEYQESLARTNKILKITANISKSILTSSLGDIHKTLETIGKTLSFDVVFIYHTKEESSVYHYWKVNIVSEKQPCKCHDISGNSNDADILSWIVKNQPYHGGVNQIPPNLQSVFNAKIIDKTSSTVIIPIYIQSQPWGIIGFVNKDAYTWSDAEMDALSSLGSLLAIVTHQMDVEKGLQQHIAERFSQINQLYEDSGH